LNYPNFDIVEVGDKKVGLSVVWSQQKKRDKAAQQNLGGALHFV
jgi:hypothetical protein